MQRKRFVFVFLVTSSILFFAYQEQIMVSLRRINQKVESLTKGFLNITVTNHLCVFPNLKYNDTIALDYLKRDYDYHRKRYDSCENITNEIELIKITDTAFGSLVTLDVQYIYENFNLTDNELKCFIRRFDKKMNLSGNEWSLDTFETFYFENATNYMINLTHHGFYHVNCKAKYNKTSDIILFENVYTIFPKNISLLANERKQFQKYEKALHKKINLIEEDPVLANEEIQDELLLKKELNVLMMGFDSLSHNHFRRVLPLTYKYLTEELSNNVVFKKFNSVGLNTYPNLMPLLSGALISNLGGLNMSSENGAYTNNDGTYHDQFPFIWYEYEQKGGYLTSFQEDQPNWALCNYLKKGFRYRPTSFYGRPYWIKYYDIRNGGKHCHNGKPMYKSYIEQIQSFLERMTDNPDTPYFSFNFITDYTHDTLSIPGQMDTAFYNAFKRFEENGYFKNTLLVVFSDHGNRLTSFPIYTTLGKLERFLPFLSIRVPDVFVDSPLFHNIKSNSDKLVGFFDVHQTLRHFLHINMELTSGLDTTQYKTNDYKTRHLRGISLFEPISNNRTCLNALIPDEQCACYQRLNISNSDLKSRTSYTFNNITDLILKSITDLTIEIRKLCEPYKLDRIDTAKYLHLDKADLYQFIVILQPGDAWFEVYLEQTEPNKLKINGKVSRISKYGDQSKCINDSFLRNYCYCKR